MTLKLPVFPVLYTNSERLGRAIPDFFSMPLENLLVNVHL
jgi:hypothetical protein